MKFELGHNEIGDTDEPEHQLAVDLAGLFTKVDLEVPKLVPVSALTISSRTNSTPSRVGAASGRATSSTSNSSTRERTSTSRR